MAVSMWLWRFMLRPATTTSWRNHSPILFARSWTSAPFRAMIRISYGPGAEAASPVAPVSKSSYLCKWSTNLSTTTNRPHFGSTLAAMASGKLSDVGENTSLTTIVNSTNDP